MASVNLVSIGSDNGLFPAGAKKLRKPMPNYEIINSKLSSAKWLPSCLGLDAVSTAERASHSGWYADI